MVICVCRNLKESDFSSQEELCNRLLQDDNQCGKCIKEFVDVVKIDRLGREFESPHLHQKYTA